MRSFCLHTENLISFWIEVICHAIELMDFKNLIAENVVLGYNYQSAEIYLLDQKVLREEIQFIISKEEKTLL